MARAAQLEERIRAKRSAVLSRWRDLLLASYSDQAAKFMKSQKDRFANPVGSNITRSLEKLLDELIAGMNPDRAAPHLDEIIRIRSIQDFAPSDALAFVFQLKTVIREVLGLKPGEGELARELADLDQAIDRMGLLAFDIYEGCREQIHELRFKEVKSSHYMLLRRANLLVEQPGEKQEPEE